MIRSHEFVPKGGSWRGLLFDNPQVGLKPALTWTFAFEFEEIERDYGTTPVGLTVDWVPLPGVGWREMPGVHVTTVANRGAIESSIYVFDHHGFDHVDLRVLEQDGGTISAEAAVMGDQDGLGLAELRVKSRLEFDGITVQLTDVTALDEAQERLAGFTDTSSLAGTEGLPGSFTFRP